jgi:hypothetical protein
MASIERIGFVALGRVNFTFAQNAKWVGHTKVSKSFSVVMTERVRHPPILPERDEALRAA